MNLFYTPEAVEDLRRLREFIRVKNPNAAATISAELREGISVLSDLPRMGRKKPQS